MNEARRRCEAITGAGERCGQFLNLSAEGLCFWHDPLRAEEAAAARSRGGEVSGQLSAARAARTVRHDDPPPPLDMTLDGIARYQAWHIQQVAAGKFDAKKSGSITYSLTLLARCLEKVDLEEQLKAARAELAKLRQPGRRGAA